MKTVLCNRSKTWWLFVRHAGSKHEHTARALFHQSQMTATASMF
jgi:hypothetical protein